MSSSGHVSIVEVGPRDGLQNEAVSVSLEQKLELIQRLVDCGARTIEATSFVNPAAIPQLADADHLIPLLPAEAGISYICLVPNERGYDRALVAGANCVEVFTAATDAFCEANTRCTVDESFVRFQPILERSVADGIRVRGAVSVAFHCPYSGPVEPDRAVDVAKRLFAIGCYEVAICDTIGRAAPDEVGRLLACASGVLPFDRLAMHFHDTFGQAVSNVEVAFDAGIRTFDASIGGLGGCPFAPGAPGNVSTQAVQAFFAPRGLETGLDADQLNETAAWIRTILGKPIHAT